MRDEAILIRDFGKKPIMVEKGLARAILPELREKPYYQWVSDEGSRDYDSALYERITKPFEAGMLVVRRPDGSILFDDRKLGFSGLSENEDGYIMKLAPTHFQETKEIEARAVVDPVFKTMLEERGKKEYGDANAYFTLPVGMTVLPLTADGGLHLFLRSNDSEIFPSVWHGIGGHLDTDYVFMDGEGASKTFDSLIREGALNELKEETGVEGSFLEPLIVNSDGYSISFDYCAHISMSSKEFLKSYSNAKDRKDHTRVVVLNERKDI